MKFTKASWLILSAGIFIVILAGLGLTRSQQLQQQDQLDEELSKTGMRLDTLQVKELRQQQDELQGQLDESNTQLVAAKDRLRQTVESINVTDKFFAIAKSCGTLVENINSSDIKDEKLEDITCSMITLNAVVSGETPNLINFIIKLNTDFTTGVVKSAQISIPEASEEDNPSASIQMVVYTYKGD